MAKKSMDLTQEQEQVLEDVQEKSFTPKCGHINKQYVGVNGKLQDIACTLPRGHDGDHQADTDVLRLFNGSWEHAQLERFTMSQQIINGTVVPQEYVKVRETAYWSDAAGTPASEIKPDPVQLARLKESRQPGIDGKAYAESHGNK